MARLLEEARGRESASVKKVKEDKGVKEMDISIEEEKEVGENSETEKTHLGDSPVRYIDMTYRLSIYRHF